MAIQKNNDYLGEARGRLPAQFKFDPLPFGPLYKVSVVGSGTLQLSGSPQAEHTVFVRIDSNGNSGAAAWSYNLDGLGYVSVGAVASFTIPGTGITILLVDGGSSPSFVANDLSSFTSFWRGRIDGILQAWEAECQQLEDAMWDVFIDRCVQNNLLFGNLEDIIGKIVGQPREGFSDAVYAILITARIQTNRSDGKRETLIAITLLLIPGSPVVVKEFVGAVEIDALNPPTVPANVIALDFLIRAVAAGVRLYFIWSGYDVDDTFTLSSVYGGADGIPTQGFGYTGDPSLGGHLTGVFSS